MSGSEGSGDALGPLTPLRLVDSADKTAVALGMPESCERVVRATDRLLDTLAQREEVWVVRPGMRLAGLRRAVLRVLAPFVERQTELDRDLVAAVHLLSDRVSQLEAEVAASFPMPPDAVREREC